MINANSKMISDLRLANRVIDSDIRKDIEISWFCLVRLVCKQFQQISAANNDWSFFKEPFETSKETIDILDNIYEKFSVLIYYKKPYFLKQIYTALTIVPLHAIKDDTEDEATYSPCLLFDFESWFDNLDFLYSVFSFYGRYVPRFKKEVSVYEITSGKMRTSYFKMPYNKVYMHMKFSAEKLIIYLSNEDVEMKKSEIAGTFKDKVEYHTICYFG